VSREVSLTCPVRPLDCGALKLPDVKLFPRWVRIAILVAAVYGFLLSIVLLGDGFKLLGGQFIGALLSLTFSPVSGMFIGMLTTSIVQSSSCTTSLVVGLVASGTLDVTHAVPIVMGANIGTTVTNTLVSMAHITRRQEFAKAFPAAIVHDIFNVLTVCVLLPVEIAFQPLARGSALLARAFAGVGGFTFASPLKVVTEPVARAVAGLVGSHGWLLIVIALALLFLALKFLVDMMRSLVSRRLELVVDRYLFGNAAKALLLGLFVTAIVQSSSVALSIVVPLAGAGLLTVRQVFPYALGANVGTTVTAMLASLVTGSTTAIQVAFAHLLFNMFGGAVWYPLRVVPVKLAEWWGVFCAKRRALSVIYVLVVFFLIPLIVVIIIRRT